jgi:hypothetical protein
MFLRRVKLSRSGRGKVSERTSNVQVGDSSKFSLSPLKLLLLKFVLCPVADWEVFVLLFLSRGHLLPVLLYNFHNFTGTEARLTNSQIFSGLLGVKNKWREWSFGCLHFAFHTCTLILGAALDLNLHGLGFIGFNTLLWTTSNIYLKFYICINWFLVDRNHFWLLQFRRRIQLKFHRCIQILSVSLHNFFAKHKIGDASYRTSLIFTFLNSK